jgi:CubicO group peptidase (beta-lactamase class C family)
MAFAGDLMNPRRLILVWVCIASSVWFRNVRASGALRAAAQDRWAKIESILEKQRDREHIPGLVLVVVKGDRVDFLKALGWRDLEQKLPVTADTLFPIGSCTKAFTAMAAAISHDQGLLSLDDSPHVYLPHFKMADSEADTLVTLRDMLSHRTGLKAYADLAAEPAVLSREQYLRAAVSAKPVARLREKFQYSNAMYTAAGEALATANHSTWDAAIESQIFGPLGMKSSVTSAHSALSASDHATGYVYRAGTRDWRASQPPESLKVMAPAGSIASTARDMARWLRLLLGEGEFEGKRLLRAATFRELTSPHIAINERWSYGLGWVLYDWNGHRVVEHNGGSQGISALVSFMPERHVGFVFLANTSPNFMTAIGNAGKLLWPLILGENTAAPGSSAGPPGARAQPSGSPPKPAVAPLPSPSELIARMIQAYGGEKNLRRHRSVEIRARKSYDNQGVQADLIIRAAEPGLRSEDEVWFAAGIRIGRVRTYVDGGQGGQETTFGQDAKLEGEELAQARRTAAMHEILDLCRLYKEVKVEGSSNLGDEIVYRLRLIPEVGKPSVLCVSARTGLILRREGDGKLATYGDFRIVDGEIVSHRTTAEESLGAVSTEVKQVRFGVEFPTGTFGKMTGLR